ncbi:MAG: DUF1906 domain-containing protein [Anaerolineales bacterium]|nr:DUF1906 domain-containing protein [Anaerolineales bacterium]
MPVSSRRAVAQPEAGLSSTISAFAPLSETAGWLLTDSALFLTRDAGQSWATLAPETGSALLIAAFFLDEVNGWLLAVSQSEAGDPAYTLLRTRDGGRTWAHKPLGLFAPGAPEAFAESAHLFFLDAQTGWLVVKQAGSANFSLGALFHTADGGETWARQTIPLGEPVRFVTPEIGWTAGGVTGAELYRTTDGGASWQPVSLEWGDAARAQLQPPLFDSRKSGAMPVVVRDESGARLEWRTTADAGETWQRARSFSLPRGLQRLEWRTAQLGWALSAEGRCNSETCTTTTRLLRTSDGGETWSPLRLPGGAVEVNMQTAAEPLREQSFAQALQANTAGRVRTVTGQGFDSCTMPTLAEMQDWFTNSPYRVWNLYIGGSSRAPCGTLTANYIAELAVQGWRFIPTWVGPQAACSGFPSRMSMDPAVAYQQGIAEADAAVARAAALGLTYSNRGGTVLYYDLEAYDVKNVPCREAARAFISGWTEQVRARGNVAGVYGATCTSALSDFALIENVPDVIWAAYWLLPYRYRPDASVFNLPCLDNSLWVNGQRLRQYSGGHNQTWGATTLNIDSNVLSGVVADLRTLDGQTSVALELHQEPDYGGSAVCATDLHGWFNLSACGEGWDNQLSSFKLRLGWSVRLYRDADLSGPSVCLVLSDPDLSNDRFSNGAVVDNQASSLKIYPNGSCMEHTVYMPLVAR